MAKAEKYARRLTHQPLPIKILIKKEIKGIFKPGMYHYRFVLRKKEVEKTRMVVHGQLVDSAVCLSDRYDVYLLDIVRDTRQNFWTMIYRSQ